MKKLKIVITVFLIIISVLIFAVIAGRFVIIDKLSNNAQINDAVEKIDTIINDENTKIQVNEFVQQLVDDGVLDEQQIDQYVKVIEEEPDLSLNINGKTLGKGETSKPTEAPKSEKPKSKTERILSAMTPAEASFAMSVYSRVNVNEVMSLMKTDKAAAKKYVTDRLSSEEISRALSIYSKYSYLLKE